MRFLSCARAGCRYSEKPQSRIGDIAVLPFTNVGGDPGDQAFIDGLYYTITGQLTALEQFQGTLAVIPAADVIRNGIASSSEASEAFSVNLVLAASVQRVDDIVRLTLNLIDTRTGLQL